MDFREGFVGPFGLFPQGKYFWAFYRDGIILWLKQYGEYFCETQVG